MSQKTSQKSLSSQTKKFVATFSILSTVFVSLAITNQIKAIAANPTIITNTATVNTTTTDLNNLNNTATVNDKLCYKADLSATLTAGSTNTNSGSSISYTGVISNDGPSTVTSLDIVVTYKSAEQSAPTLSTSGGTLTQTNSITTALGVTTTTYSLTGISLASGGSKTINFASTIENSALGTATLSYSVTPTGPTNNDPLCAMADPNLTNNTATAFTNILASADVSIVKTSSGGSSSNPLTGGALVTGTLYSGDSASYTLTIANLGPSKAVGPITVVDTMPTEVTPQVVSGSNYTASTNWNCQFNSSTRAMTCVNNNDLNNGGATQIVLGVKVN